MRKNPRVLDLPLKKEWYDMIESGIKTEEYRDLKPFWVKRIFRCYRNCSSSFDCSRCGFLPVSNVKLEQVCFRYGYTSRHMVFAIESITVGLGNPDWGAPAHPVIIIKLGERIS